MLPQAFALRPVRWTDLPALRRWRGLPAVQRHLRHPTPPSWFQHLRWFRRTHTDPTCWVRAVTRNGQLVGVVGFYYLAHQTGELSVLCVDGQVEAFDWEYRAAKLAMQDCGLRHVWGEVYPEAPIGRKALFSSLLTRVRSIPAWVHHRPFKEGSAFYWTTLG